MGMPVLSQFAEAVLWRSSDLESQERGEFGGLPTHLTCHLAGPPVYEPASPLASRRAQAIVTSEENLIEAKLGLRRVSCADSHPGKSETRSPYDYSPHVDS
jgi:hypothetical protein